MTTSIDYVGNELELFSHAVNWKLYWSQHIRPWIGKRVLEVGAGSGVNAHLFKSLDTERWLSIEPDKDLYALLHKLPASEAPCNFETRQCVSSDLGPEEIFDTILYIDVLEHIEKDRDELERSCRNLAIGGRIIVLSPAHNFLFSAFDNRIGHFRRYNTSLMRCAIPKNCQETMLHYLDGLGMVASLSNRILLKQDTPTIAQIKTWDGYIVPISKWLDPISRFSIGKTIICVMERVS